MDASEVLPNNYKSVSGQVIVKVILQVQKAPLENLKRGLVASLISEALEKGSQYWRIPCTHSASCSPCS